MRKIKTVITTGVRPRIKPYKVETIEAFDRCLKADYMPWQFPFDYGDRRFCQNDVIETLRPYAVKHASLVRRIKRMRDKATPRSWAMLDMLLLQVQRYPHLMVYIDAEQRMLRRMLRQIYKKGEVIEL